MNCKYLRALVFASLISIISTSTSSASTPVVTQDDIYNLFKEERELGDLKRIVRLGKSSEHGLWNAAMGAENLGKVNYFLMVEAIKVGNFKFARKMLTLLLTSSDSQESKDRIIAKLKWNRSILEILYEATNGKSLTSKQETDLQTFKIHLGNDLYTGDYHSIYENYEAVSEKSVFTEDEWNFAKNVPYVDLIRIMVSRIFKANGRNRTAHQLLFEQDLYDNNRINVPLIKMLIGMKVPMIKGDKDVNLRSEYYRKASGNQKLRADLLDLIYLRDFGDDVAHMNRVIPDFRHENVLTIIADDNRRKYLPAMFMNPSIGLYQSKWILQAIKFGDNAALTCLLEERVPLPSDEEIDQAINLKYSSSGNQAIKDLIDRYRQFYDPVTRLCLEGPKFCKARPAARTVTVTVTAPRVRPARPAPAPAAGTFTTDSTESNPLGAAAGTLIRGVEDFNEADEPIDSDYEYNN